MGNFWSTWAALCFAALTALTALPGRAEVVTELAPFTWDSARPDVLVLDGEITRRTPPLLGLALGRFDAVEVLELSSPGGDAYAAMAMVPTIRAAGLATRITAGDTCHSACSFLYLAGTERAAEGELGVHQLASANEASGHFIMNDVLDVFSDLGVPDAVRRRMMQTPPGEMYVFSPLELVALGLVGPANPQAPPDPTPPKMAAPAPQTPIASPPEPAAPVAEAPTAPATHLALDIAGEATGRVVIELFDALAPEHAARLVTLAREGAYDGVVFHRVSEGFMATTGDVQFGKAGGDLARAGTGGSRYPDLAAELSDQPFVEGTVGMGESYGPYSANSQFYILLQPIPGFDGRFTAVGKVVEGLDVARRIKRWKWSDDGVPGAPDQIVRALASIDGTKFPPIAQTEPPFLAPEDAKGFEVKFDFSEPGRVTLHVKWRLPEELTSLVDCVDGETTMLEHGLVECVISFSGSEDELLQRDPQGGVTFAKAYKDSRKLSINLVKFLSDAAPIEEEVVAFRDSLFSLVIVANRIEATTGDTTDGGTTAKLVHTWEQIVENPDTIPATFVTRFY